MFCLSPKEDLILLAARHNHPSLSWSELSSLIMQQQMLFIPADVCRDRYEKFLYLAENNHSELAPPLPSCLRSYADQSTANLLAQANKKIPENFIFVYKQLKSKLQESSHLRLACLQRYEKGIVSRLLGFSNSLKTKPIRKGEFPKKSIRDDTNGQQLVSLLYAMIKQRSEADSVLTEEIAQQKIELLLSEILEYVNERVLKEKTGEQIGEGLQLIRFMRNRTLFQKRRHIFELYFFNMTVDSQNYLQIQSLFKAVQMIYHTYQSQTGRVIVNSIDRNSSDHTAAHDENKQPPPAFISRSEGQLLEEETLLDSLLPFKQLGQSDSSQALQIQLKPISSIKQLMFELLPPEQQLKLEEELLKSEFPSEKAHQEPLPEKSLTNQPQANLCQASCLQQQRNQQESFASNFQVTISNSLVSISQREDYAKLDSIHCQKKLQQGEVKQENFNLPVKEEVKKEEIETEVKLQEGATSFQKRGHGRKRVPSRIGKIWLILND